MRKYLWTLTALGSILIAGASAVRARAEAAAPDPRGRPAAEGQRGGPGAAREARPVARPGSPGGSQPASAARGQGSQASPTAPAPVPPPVRPNPGALQVTCTTPSSDSSEAGKGSSWSWSKVGRDVLLTIVYSLLGLAIALFGYQVYHWITPFDLRKELEVDQNTALGIVAGAIILGLCIIVAAAILSP